MLIAFVCSALQLEISMGHVTHRPTVITYLTVYLFAAVPFAIAVEPPTDRVDRQRVRTAIERSLKRLELASAGSADERTCFTCHNQAMPILVIAEAQLRGFKVDESNLKRQVEHTYTHLARGKKNYLAGKGQGGKVDTAGYALWALADGGRMADEVTTAVVEFLLQYQLDRDHWRSSSHRPPSEASPFTSSFVALQAMRHFGTDAQKERIRKREQQLTGWLESAKPKDTEDEVFRLRAWQMLDFNKQRLLAAAADLMAEQQDDGGWRQNGELASDAYATGSVLLALREGRFVGAEDAVFQRGIMFLLQTQQEDGSWHVASRSKPFQTYYETGFPHEKDQFISCAASSWASLALLQALPLEP
jgi:N-acyl-D-amino-acid deacylase